MTTPHSRKPLKRLQEFTRLLGWQPPLRLQQHHIKEKDAPPDLRARVITWYEAGTATGRRGDCFLQINEFPIGQTVTYTAAVYAIRYRICTGWHGFRLPRRDEDPKRETARLAKWLAWDWFATPQKRRTFRLAHPQCAGHSWRTIRDGREPGSDGQATWASKGSTEATKDTPEKSARSPHPRKPLKRLQKLVHLLGWQFPLQLHQSRTRPIDGLPGQRRRVITCYGVGEEGCGMRIDESPAGQTTTYVARVYASRYRIFSNWYKFRLPRRDEDLKREAARLAKGLAWNWFASPEKRRAYRQAHPECVV